MMWTYILVFVFFVLFSVLGLYILSTYFFPRKLDEIAEMIEKGQTRLAIKKLEDILSKDDHNVYAHYLLGEAFSKDGNGPYAVLEYRQVLKYATSADKINEISVRTKLAKLLKDQKKVNDAKNEYLMLTKIDPNNYENFYELGVLFYDSGMVDKAAPYLRKATELNTKHSNSFYYYGQALYRSGSNKDAKNALAEAIKLDPSNYKAHYFLGLVLRQLGDSDWAIKEFEIAQKSDDIKTKCFLAKGTCYMEKEQYPKAVIEFERGLKTAARGSDTELNMRYFLAAAYEKQRDMHSAIANWERIYEVNRKFRDVEQKLKQNEEFRQDDHIKDFLIATLSNFELTTRKIIEKMGLEIQETKVISDTDIEIFASEPDDNRRNTRRTNKLIRIIRTTDGVNESFLRKLHESMKLRNAQRVVVISTGELSREAVDFANTRPIELYGKAQLIEFLRAI